MLHPPTRCYRQRRVADDPDRWIRPPAHPVRPDDEPGPPRYEARATAGRRRGATSPVNSPRAYVRVLLPIAIIAAGATVISGAIYQLRIGGTSGNPLSVAYHPAEGKTMAE